MADWTGYLLLFCIGCVAGTVNVIAGGGSFLTLPLLIFLGLSPTVANATNRVGIVLQNVGAIWTFRSKGLIEVKSLLWGALPATVGAVGGTWLALRVEEDAFKQILAFLMVVVTLWTLWDPLKSRRPGVTRERPFYLTGMMVVGFFFMGIYGGFIQAGVGFFILSVTTLGGLDLVRGNAVKALTVLCFSTIALSIFAWQGKVDWGTGLVLAAGMIVGGQIGVRLTVRKGHAWVRGIVTGLIILFALRLLL
ncbi:MAG: sulfite exporter TauE/SafE family protein [Acidobacteriota bacterium]